MSLFREIPPTAGLPVYAADLSHALLQRNLPGSLEEDFKNYLGAPYAAVTYSGTAAFYLILETLKGLSPKKTVIIPAFICPLLPLAIKRAGLEVLVCDINKDNFNFATEQLKDLCSANRDILAIVAVHLAGLPVDLETVQKIAAQNNAFVIEDCAQSLGAAHKNKRTGAFGDFSFFSLCRGKGLTAYEGGVLVCNRPQLIQPAQAAIKRLVKNAPFSEFLKILELFGYWIFYRPLLFWFVFRLPQLFWEMQGKFEKAYIEYFTVNFGLHKVSGIRKACAHAAFPRLEKEISRQRRSAAFYISALKDTPGIKLITEAEGDFSNYPYLTLLFDEPLKRNKALNAFRDSGLGVSLIYLNAVSDYGYLKLAQDKQTYPNARSIAKRHLTLTTSLFLKEKDLQSVIEKIKGL